MSDTGIKKRVPFDVYKAMPGTNFSLLKEMARSPLHYSSRVDAPKMTTAMTLGSAAHTAILEPHRFLAEYALWDERDEESGKVKQRRGKVWEAFKASCGTKRIVKADEYTAAMAMRDAVRGHKAAFRYLKKGDPEVTMTWEDAEYSRLCKGRLDWLTNVDGMDVLVGLKTARDCRPIPFGNAAARMGYHLQWSLYKDGYETLTRKEVRVVEIVVENLPPYDVVVYDIRDDVIEAGREEYRRLLGLLRDCEASGDWHGAAEEEQILSLPSWVYHAEDDISDLGLELTNDDSTQEAG